MKSLCIVGGGGSGISLLYNLSKELSFLDILKIEKIDIYDGGNFDGGFAYRTKEDHHIINMSASRMSVDIHDKLHFCKWLANNEYALDIVPRYLYSKYLNDVLSHATNQLKKVDVLVRKIPSFVIDVDFTKNNEAIIFTDNSKEIYDFIFLATGHNPPKNPLSKVSTITPRKLQYIDNKKYKNICIIGTSLTAIDTIFDIKKRQPDSILLLVSRSGMLPKVQPFNKQELNHGFYGFVFKNIHGMNNITADYLVDVLNNGLSKYYGGSEKITNINNSNIIKDPLAILEFDILNSIYSDKCISSYLDSVHSLVCEAWINMTDIQKGIFMDKYNSSWMINRHAMPLYNAVKIRNYLKHGSVKIIKASLFQELDAEQTFVNERFDLVVNCTSPSYDSFDNKLISNLVNKKYLKSNKYGGVLKDNHQPRNCYLLGQLNKGTYFYTAAMEAVVNNVKNCINEFVGDNL